MDFVVVAKKGVADLDNRALSEALEKLMSKDAILLKRSHKDPERSLRFVHQPV